MSDNYMEQNSSSTVLWGVLLVGLLGVLALILSMYRKPSNVYCTTALIGKPSYASKTETMKASTPTEYPKPAPANPDPYFNTEKMMPKVGGEDQPEWTKAFARGDNMLLQQNFIDTTDTEKFQLTRSVCGRRFMSRDIRKVPTVTRDPRTVTSFNLPVINPECALEFNELSGI